MRGFVPTDPNPDANVSSEHFAVVYVPRRSRKRFSIGCVEIKSTKDDAISSADHTANKFAARVIGPSKSSEGQYLYYLVEWIN